MTLREWLDAQPAGALARLAEATDLNIRSLHRYAARVKPRTPPLKSAIRISGATGGKVRVKDLVQGASDGIEPSRFATLSTDARGDFDQVAE